MRYSLSWICRGKLNTILKQEEMMHMSVEKFFWKDPYLTELEVTVKSVDKDVITVDKTIAYAFAGGQKSDVGSIGGFDIVEARKDGTEIFYRLTPQHTLNHGDLVLMKIDWEKRYRIMRLHFAAELVLELVYQGFNHPQKIGANITEEKARVDFYWEGNIAEIFPFLQDKLQQLITADLDIHSEFSDPVQERRYWEIEGFGKVECGGTHIRRTGEIGRLALKRVNPGAGKERIEITLLDREKRDEMKAHIYLTTPSPVYKDEFQNMVLAYQEAGELDYYEMYKGALEDFDAYVEKVINNAKGIGIPEDWARNHSFWLVDDEGHYLGVIRIRTEKNNEFVNSYAGNIGYDISPLHRKRGYGKEILRLGLEQARILGLDRALLTCNHDNIASAKIIEANGGVFESEDFVETKKARLRRYWVPCGHPEAGPKE